jgi:hypothetical protein
MAASGFFGAQRPRGGSFAAGEKSQKPPLQEGDRPAVRSATERPRGAAWGRDLGDDWQHLGLSKNGRHPWWAIETYLADAQALSCRGQPVASTTSPSLHIKGQAGLREGGHAVRRRQITLDKRSAETRT